MCTTWPTTTSLPCVQHGSLLLVYHVLLLVYYVYNTTWPTTSVQRGPLLLVYHVYNMSHYY